MDNWQDSVNKFIPVLVFIGIYDMLRRLLAPELEKKLGRKFTDWEWQYYLHESNLKAEVDSRQQLISQCRQSLNVRQMIHDFVWNGG